MEIGVLLFLILLNGFFALSEIVFVGSKKIKILDSLKRGNNNARTVLKFMQEPEKYLSAMQVGITLIGISSGMFGGLALADNFTLFLEQFGFFGSYTHDVALIAIVGLITYLSIVIGELFPKTIGLKNPEKILLYIIPIVHVFAKIFYPLVLFLSFSTRLLLKICNMKNEGENEENPIREIVLLTKLAVNNNKLSSEQARLLFNTININKLSLEDIMTEKEKIDFLSTTMSLTEVIAHTQKNRHTRYPVLENAHIIGYINVKDLYYTALHKKVALKSLVRELLSFRDTEKIINVFPELLKKSKHMAIVKDADDQIVGIITLENILESIVGEIYDEYDIV